MSFGLWEETELLGWKPYAQGTWLENTRQWCFAYFVQLRCKKCVVTGVPWFVQTDLDIKKGFVTVGWEERSFIVWPCPNKHQTRATIQHHGLIIHNEIRLGTETAAAADFSFLCVHDFNQHSRNAAGKKSSCKPNEHHCCGSECTCRVPGCTYRRLLGNVIIHRESIYSRYRSLSWFFNRTLKSSIQK